MTETSTPKGYAVKVCPECDIADCKHIRATDTGMVRVADLTDMKAEPVAQDEAYALLKNIVGHWDNHTGADPWDFIEFLLPHVQKAAAFIEANPAASIVGESEQAKDAARYRWLRGQHWNDSGVVVVVEPKLNVKLGASCPSGKILDDFIDAALGASGES